MESTVKRAQAHQRAVELYEKLMALPRPGGMSNNEWATKAGLNTSFFVNIKKGSEPSIGNLRKALAAVGISLSEFFLDEADGQLIQLPNSRKLAEILDEVLPNAPRRADRRAAFLAEAILHGLALHSSQPTKRNDLDQSAGVSRAPATEPHAATN